LSDANQFQQHSDDNTNRLGNVPFSTSLRKSRFVAGIMRTSIFDWSVCTDRRNFSHCQVRAAILPVVELELRLLIKKERPHLQQL